MQKQLLLLFFCIIVSSQIRAQQSLVAAGGDTVLSADGSFSFSIGQISHIEFTGNGLIVNNGVQQAFEIYSLEVENPVLIKFDAMLYPNPTESDIILRINQDVSLGLSYQLFDIQGKFLLQSKIIELETVIPLNRFASGTYILKVLAKDSSFKHFKIIKK